ncbi:hypothetical protein L1987_89406 [Smallanthus sonchifolius]|nr:hypothetical protein L1987_89406 [Smallanthus sonchifolius]
MESSTPKYVSAGGSSVKKEVDRNEIRLAAIFDSDLILGEEVDWEAKADPSTSTASHDSQLRVASPHQAASIAKCSATKQALPNTTDAEVGKPEVPKEVGGRKYIEFSFSNCSSPGERKKQIEQRPPLSVRSSRILSEVVLVLVHLCLDMIYHVTYALSCCNGVIAAHVRGHLLIHLMTDARPLLLLLQSILLLGSS